MKIHIKSVVLSAVALAFCFVGLAFAQTGDTPAPTLKTDAEIEAMGYTHIYSLEIPDQPNFRTGAQYSLDNSNLNLGPIESVAYRLNLGENNFCYTSFGAYTSDLKRIGVPTFTSQTVMQRYVQNLYYEAKSPSLNTTGTTVAQGNIEFWPWNYGTGNAAGIPNASGANGDRNFDFGDTCNYNYDYGSMQVHDYQNKTTVFALNRWNVGQQACLGIGNCSDTSKGLDWTHNYNTASYETKQLDVFAKPVFSQMSASDYAAISGEVSNMKLVYKLDCPLQEKYSTNNYQVNNAVSSDISGMPLSRVGYYMVMEKADGTVQYAYTSFDAPTNDLSKVGLPFDGSNWSYQQTINNMTVQSNVQGVVNGSGITGNININRLGDGTNDNYSCFQIYNSGAGEGSSQTVMALNAWNGEASSADRTIDMGIGNNTASGGSSNYINDGERGVNSNASQYNKSRSLYVLAQAAIAPEMKNVTEGSKYQIVQGARLTSQMNAGWNADFGGVDYDIVDNVAELKQTLGPFDRVGYYMEYAQNASDPLKYVFVSFDAMTNDISKIGVPTNPSGEFYQQTVKNLHVTTNATASDGLITDPSTGTQVAANNTISYNTGYLEFWASNYSGTKGTVISQGSDSTYDINDSGGSTGYGHGSMQIHSLDTEQTIFAVNHFNGGKQFGIGTNPTSTGAPDWTNNNTKQGYAIANIYTFAKPVLSDMETEHFNVIKDEAPGMHLFYKLNCPLYATNGYSADNYTVNNVIIDKNEVTNLPAEMQGMPVRVAYYMTLEKADGSMDYAYASFNSPTNDVSKLGLPFNGSDWSFGQNVNNMTVVSNVNGVENRTKITGNININRTYKLDEESDSSYSCFQINNSGAGEGSSQTVMSLNAWNGEASSADRTIDIGIGNNYTNNGELGAASNASQYTNRTLYVMGSAAIAPGMDYVPDGSKYKVVQGARLTTQMSDNWQDNDVNYDIVNNVAQLQNSIGPLERVGYYMEYAPTVNDQLKYVFVSFNAMTNDVSKIGVPTVSSGELYQQEVYNLQVTTNVPASEGLITDPGTNKQVAANKTISYNTGYLEFWPNNYTAPVGNNKLAGSSDIFDINDTIDGRIGHGSMQVHSLDTEQTIFALNGFNQTKQFGIGTNPNASTNNKDPQADWTFDSNKSSYKIANIYTFAKPVLGDMDAEHFNPIKEEAANMRLVYKLDCPLYSSGYTAANNYTVNNLSNLGDLAGMPLKRVAYYMALEKADGSVDYAYASYDALTNDPEKIGMPFGNNDIRQTTVNNLTVSSNVNGVVNGTGLSGNIEMWNRNYTQGNSANIPGASGSEYDFGDQVSGNGTYASFQIHNYGDKQTVMALNAWNGTGSSATRTIDIGIGNNTGHGSPDYTFNGDAGAESNASQYANRTLYIMAQRAIAPGMENVVNASDYTLVQGVRLTMQMGTNWNANGVNYDIVDNLASLQSQGILFDRVGYYMEYAQNASDPLTYVFVSFDAMTTDLSKIGIPISSTKEYYAQKVNNLEFTTNVQSDQGKLFDPASGQQVTANKTYSQAQGYIEFWSNNYTNPKNPSIEVGSGDIYDVSDTVTGIPGATGYGSMQVHSLETGQTIFALNRFEGDKAYGIGTNPNAQATSSGAQADYTFDYSKSGYKIANVYTYVHQVDALLSTNAMSMYQRDLTNQANVTLSGKWAATNGVTIDSVQASVDGGDWITMIMNGDGTFSSESMSLQGGMHSVSYQALDASGAVLATNSGQIGVGEIFITAGQSNSTNCGDIRQTSTSGLAFAYNPVTEKWEQNCDQQFGPLDGSQKGSTWPSFTDTMAELEGVPVATYSVGYSGTNLSQWLNDEKGGILTNMKNAIKFLNENADGFAGILWHQGESGKGNTTKTYEEALTELIEISRTAAGNEDLPWGVAIASANASGVVNTTVTGDQKKVIEKDPMVFLGVDTDEFFTIDSKHASDSDYETLRGTNGNSIHLSEKGLKEAGRLWALTAGESIVGLRKYWFANSAEAVAVHDWEVNGGYKLGVKLVSGTNDSVEVSNEVQMLEAGTVEVGEGYTLTLAGGITGSGALEKTGKGELTLSGDASEFTGKTTVSDGTLKLASGGTLYDLSGGSEVKPGVPNSVYNPANLVSEGDLTLISNSDSDTKFIGKIDAAGKTVTKTGAGTLKIYSDENNVSTAGVFIVDVGELDFKGYFNGNLEVKPGATLSPGNSVGDLTVFGNVKIDAGATGLFEFKAYNPDPESQEFDTLTVEDDGAFELVDGSIIQLYFENGDQNSWARKDAEYQLVIGNVIGNDDTDWNSFLGNYQTLFALEGRTDGLYLIGLGAPENPGVPEPSTWALLILGTAGLLFWRKRKNS